MKENAQKVRFDGEPRHSWKAAVGRWTLEILPDLKPGTAKRYQVSVKQAAPWLEAKYVDEIDRKVIAGFVSGRKKHKATNATIRRDLSAVGSVLAGCVVWGWSEINPAKLYDRAVLRERRDPIVLPDERDIDVVIGRCPGNLAKMARFCQFTGMRQEEAAGLQRPAIDIKRRAVALQKTKTGRARVVTLDDRAHGTIHGTPSHIKSKWVFWHGDDGDRYLNVSSRFAAIVGKAYQDKAISRPFRFHDLRHWFAVDYLRQGGNIYTLQQELGHSTIRTTEQYLAFLTPAEAERAKYGTAQILAQ